MAGSSVPLGYEWKCPVCKNPDYYRGSASALAFHLAMAKDKAHTEWRRENRFKSAPRNPAEVDQTAQRILQTINRNAESFRTE
ncbi:MAG: hypothetical protein ACE5OY_05985 [Candidatus Bathyarchaeia archaeon]